MSVYAVCGQEADETELPEINQITQTQKAQTTGEVTNYRFESFENEKKHIECEYEQSYLDAIRKGDMEYFEKPVYDKLHLTYEVGKLAEGGLKQMEYMVAAGLTLASRAAIEGGVSPAEAYAFSDVYFQKLEKCRTQVEMFRLHSEMERKYVAMVHEKKMKKRSSYYVEPCKDYLTQNIHKRVTVEELAKQIGVNRTYLSGQFSEQEGMSISRYSILVRLRAAENMLKYSEASISTISDYLFFLNAVTITGIGEIFAMNGEYMPVYLKYGYLKDPEDKHHLIIDPEAAEVVKLVFTMAAEGKSKSNIALYLNEKHVLTCREYMSQKGINLPLPSSKEKKL